MSVKGKIQLFLRRRGVVLKRFDAFESEIHQVVRAFERAGCCVLFDIGANEGQFASECREAGYSGTIISVEPQSAAHTALSAKASHARDWFVAERCALGDKAEKTTINIAANSVSSSLLAVTDLLTNANRDTQYVGTEAVDLLTLDTLASRHLRKDKPLALKIDTQGYEMAVLNGAARTLEQVAVLYLEMSLVPLYSNAAGFKELFDHVCGLGFRCIGLFPGFTDTKTFEVLQVNGLFTRQLPRDFLAMPA
jgi:FkbM family methyltransferase